ncbi:MAG TPA: hydrogenase maturation peptidase HycI [Spirochaetia bacterium]|nr:hydrogenase maturation peptidase HycI [Spirochaetia bacterium]
MGSELRSDDAVGVLVARRIAEKNLKGVWSLSGGTAPENFTADVRQISPTHVLIVDSADMGEPAGAIRLLDPADIGGISFGTHALPLGVLAGFLVKETGCRVIVIGIQPESIEFGEQLSSAVRAALEKTVQAIVEAVGAS